MTNRRGLRRGNFAFVDESQLGEKLNVLIPGLLQLTAPVTAMQNVIEGGDRFDHQEMPYRRGLWRGDFAFVDESQLGEKLDRIFASTTGDALYTLLTGNGLQRHRHQRAQPFVLHGGVNCHKADGGFIVGVDV
ncbi:hypothetical protein D3C78_932470 [compost metagenome]